MQGNVDEEDKTASKDEGSVEDSGGPLPPAGAPVHSAIVSLTESTSSVYPTIHSLVTLILFFLVLRRELRGNRVLRFGEGNERFSPAAGLDNVVYVSGQVGDTSSESIQKQAETALEKVDAVLK